MRRLLLSSLIIGLFGAIVYSAQGTPSTLVVRTDANNYLLVTSVTQTNPVTQGVFSSRILRTDSSGSLQVVLTGTVTPTYPMAVPASTCAAPSLGLSGGATTGIAFTATPSILNCVSGTARTTLTATTLTSTVVNSLPLGSATAAALNFGTAGTGLYAATAADVLITTSGVARLRVVDVDAVLNATQILSWGSSGINSPDISLSRTAAALLGSNASMAITRGTITTDLKVQDDTVTWNNAGVTFTGWKLNVTDTNSAAASLLIDLQVGSASKFNVTKGGAITAADAIAAGTTLSGASILVNAADRILSTANGLVNFTNTAITFGIQFNNGASAAPTFNNGTIDAGSRNSAGKVVLTGGNTGGTVTFSTNFTNAPFCTVTGTAATDIPQITSTSVSTLVVAGITANGTFYYLCIGRI